MKDGWLAPPIALLEDNEDMRIVMACLLKARFGLSCQSFASVAQFVEGQDKVLAARVVFIDINLGDGAPTGFDAYRWLREKNFGGQIFFLTGHAFHHPQMEAINSSGVTVLEKPLPSDELERIVRKAVPELQAAR